MRMVVFGLSVTSSWGNGHATVYRGLLKALHRAGVSVTFVEKDVPWYAENRDLWECDFARVVLYRDSAELEDLLDRELPGAEAGMLGSYFPDGIAVAARLGARGGLARLYYDIDTPVSLDSFAREGRTSYLLADQIHLFDAVLSFTGGPALEELVARWGARRAVALYCALDPETHERTAPDERFRCRLSYMGTYSQDRHDAWERLFLRPATQLPECRFLLAGPQYPAMDLPANVARFEHLSPGEHSAFYSSSDLTLNITRGPMVARGYSPSVRLFEAAGCATCVVSDRWEGMAEVFDPGSEVLVADRESDMVEMLQTLGPEETASIGELARTRALRYHTYDARARQLLELIRTL